VSAKTKCGKNDYRCICKNKDKLNGGELKGCVIDACGIKKALRTKAEAEKTCKCFDNKH
jgi:CFEM domain